MASRYVLAATIIVALSAACGPGKDLPETGTASTDGPTEATTSATAGSLSHSATSVDSPTSDASLTEDAPATSASGSATTDASTTDATTDASTTDPNGLPGSLYGPCQASEPRCSEGLTCVEFEALVAGLPGEVCASACGPNVPCAPSGTPAEAMCILALDMAFEPTHCAVICDPAAPDPGCPSATSCKPVPDIPGGVCTAP